MAENNTDLQDRGELTEPTETKEQENIPVENITLGDAMAGIFSEPGETFEAVKNSTKKNYWLIPLLIVIVVTILATFLVMRDEELSASINEKQSKAMEEQFDKAVKEGKMTREDANKQIEQSKKFMSGPMMLVIGTGFSLIMVLVFFFFKSLLYWAGLKPFKSIALYTDVMNVVGLAGLITAIQTVVNTVIAVVTGKLMANIGPSLFLSEASMGKQMYALFAHMDVLNFWYLIILGIGLARVSNVKSSITFSLVLILWIIWVMLTTFGPFGSFAGM